MTANPARTTRTRTVVASEVVSEAPVIVVPRGRSKAEQRISAIAALHQPVQRQTQRAIPGLSPAEYGWFCSECKVADRYGDAHLARWPCTTVKLLGEAPGVD